MDKELLKEAMDLKDTIDKMKYSAKSLVNNSAYIDDRSLGVSCYGGYTKLFVPRYLRAVLIEDVKKTIEGEIRVMEAKLESL